MYYITYDGIIIATPSNSGFSVIAGSLSQKINAADEFTFTLPKNNRYMELLKIRDGIVELRNDNRILFRGDIISTTKNFDGSVDFVCQGALAWLNDACTTLITIATIVSDAFGRRMDEYNSVCAEKRRLLRGFCKNRPNDAIAIFNEDEYITVFSYLKNMVGEFGGILIPQYMESGTYIHYISESENMSDQEIVFGKNLLDLSDFVTADGMVNAIYPTGKDGIGIKSVNPTGQPYIYNHHMVSNHGFIAAPVKLDCETRQELYTAAVALLPQLAVLNQQITISAFDISAINANIDSINVGDNVRVVSPEHGLDTTMLCSAKTIDLLDTTKCSVTLGKSFAAISNIVASGGINA